jgi:hypothetical protein
VLTFTGLLAVLRLGRLASRLLLGYRRPTEVVVERTGVRVRTKVELLGKTLRDREIVLPREGLLAAEREVRYPRLPLYAGLLSLALGTYFGMALFVDGVRATSPDLLGLGVLFMAAGLAVDYGLCHLSQAVRGRARLVLAPRKGSRLAVEVPSAEAADQALVALR